MASKLTGNQFWRLRTKHGRDRIFGDPAVLLEEAYAYFDWCDRHPWHKVDLVKHQGSAEEAEIPIGRPYTMDGLTYFLGVSGSYFRTVKSELKDKIERKAATDNEVLLLETIELIEQAVRTQQIEGAAVGVFSQGLVARLNGLAENVNNNNTGDAVIRVSVRDQETADNLTKLNEMT